MQYAMNIFGVFLRWIRTQKFGIRGESSVIGKIAYLQASTEEGTLIQYYFSINEIYFAHNSKPMCIKKYKMLYNCSAVMV